MSFQIKHLRNINVEPKVFGMTVTELLIFGPVSFVFSFVFNSLLISGALTFLVILLLRVREEYLEKKISKITKKGNITFQRGLE